MKKYFSLFFLIALLLYASLPLFRPGFIPTHDGEYHIIRFWQFEKMLGSGSIIPRWAPDLNSGYGLPLFTFHYPFPNYIGAALHAVGYSYTDAFKVALAIGYIIANIAGFVWLRKLFSETAAITGAIVGAFVPYWFVDMYIRGSVGEVYVIMWLLIALGSIEYKRSVVLALSVAGMILSHNILAMIFLPMVTGYMLIRHKARIATFALGVGIATYFWLPAFYETRYMTGLNTVDYRDHFPQLSQLLIPSWGTGFSAPGGGYDEISQQVGIIPFFFIITAAAVWLLYKKNHYASLILYWFLIISGAFFFMISFSQPVWTAIPAFSYIQYPWRLLSVFIPATALFTAFCIERYRRMTFVVFAVSISILITRQYIRPVIYPPRDDAYYLSRREFTDGTSSLGNSFSTIWGGWMSERARRKFEVLSGDATITESQIDPIAYTFSVRSTDESFVRLNVSYYPGWRVLLDGYIIPVEPKDRVLSFRVPPGYHVGRVQFEETTLRRFADAASLLCLFIVIGSGILRKYEYRNRYITAWK